MTDRLKLAVLGTPIAHSRSPQLQQTFADCCGIADFSYERIETDCDALTDTVKRLVADGYDGFNCTMPLKTDMAALADDITHEASVLRSVNTVAVRDGRLYGDTTDGGGILLTIRRGLGLGNSDNITADMNGLIKDKRVLLLGAGGSARSTALSVTLAGAKLTILNRTLESAYSLGDMLANLSDNGKPECGALTPENMCEAAKSADILVNCTAAGMKGKPEFESLDFIDCLPEHALVIDAVYNPLETALLKRAADRGLRHMSGLWMLVYQGALAFEHWSGWLPDENACKKAFDNIAAL
ncbi:MAG: shikimate dehydrogenase [Clostridiales bacterium]|nr:shikimate dehydrogenase [Clostridiales bacterium]